MGEYQMMEKGVELFDILLQAGVAVAGVGGGQQDLHERPARGGDS
jgi:hypothetical protein